MSIIPSWSSRSSCAKWGSSAAEHSGKALTSSGSFARNADSRRSWSSARLRATWNNQPRGFSGMPRSPHCCMAVVSASCTTSSGRERRSAPKTRVSVATICPALWRNRWSTSPWTSVTSGELDSPDLDGAEIEVRAVLRQFRDGVVILGFHDEVAADDFPAFDVRTVGHGNAAVGADDDASLSVVQLLARALDLVSPV